MYISPHCSPWLPPPPPHSQPTPPHPPPPNCPTQTLSQESLNKKLRKRKRNKQRTDARARAAFRQIKSASVLLLEPANCMLTKKHLSAPFCCTVVRSFRSLFPLLLPPPQPSQKMNNDAYAQASIATRASRIGIFRTKARSGALKIVQPGQRLKTRNLKQSPCLERRTRISQKHGKKPRSSSAATASGILRYSMRHSHADTAEN